MTALRAFAGLDLLATAVMLLDRELRVRFINTACEHLLELPSRAAVGQPFGRLFAESAAFEEKLRQAVESHWGFWDQSVDLNPVGREALALNVLATPVDSAEGAMLLELRRIEQRLRVEREERELSILQASRELIRNLAHEIKNPLGGLRGSAQLLERELIERPDLREYTQVIIKEADRLQVLMDRLLTPSRPPQIGAVNIHEVCERVRSLILAEFADGIRIARDYDTSLPDLAGDREQLIQVVLNLVRNAAQALAATTRAEGAPAPEITLRTRAARQTTIARQRHRVAMELSVIDNGPGVPEAIRDRIFNPLVSGRDDGTGLGLTIAQTYVQHHHGLIECDSRPGRTVFRVVLPLSNKEGPDQ